MAAGISPGFSEVVGLFEVQHLGVAAVYSLDPEWVAVETASPTHCDLPLAQLQVKEAPRRQVAPGGTGSERQHQDCFRDLTSDRLSMARHLCPKALL